MKLLHWNVHMWRDTDGGSNVRSVADLIRQTSPDVVSLVEVDEPWGRPDGLQEIADELGYCWAFVPAFESQAQGGFGNALLSRSPLRAVQQWQLLSPRLYDGTEPSEPRTVILAQVEAGADDLWIGSTHLPHQDAAMRAEASGQLLQLLNHVNGPWVLCGDFNQPPSAWLSASSGVAPNPTVPTYPADAPTEPIDYCVLDGMIGEAQVLPSSASDHLPVVVTVDLMSPVAT